MRITFFRSDKPREHLLADAFADGARLCGDEVTMQPLTPDIQIAENADVVCMVGVKSRELFWAHWRAGIHTVYFDKGYTRQTTPGPIKVWEYWRVAVDAHHPTARIAAMECPGDRNRKIKLQPWRRTGDHIVFAGSSQKYHDFYGLRDPTAYATKIINHIKEISKRDVIYRPKPSWHGAEPIKGTRYSEHPEMIETVLTGAWALVTHGSNACFEAVVSGIPCIVLGDAVAKPISSHKLEELKEPRLATDMERRQWLANLMYHQWTLQEMASGQAWKFIRKEVYG